MPPIFTPIPSEVERKSPGAGGKPPVDRRPTGGGGGGGDDDWRSPRRGPREALHRTRAFVFCALAGDMMFFVVLVALFYARQAGTHMDPRTLRQIGDWHPVLLPPILFLNTAVLLLSSLSMEIARRHIFREFDVLEEWLGSAAPPFAAPFRGSLPHSRSAFCSSPARSSPGVNSPPRVSRSIAGPPRPAISSISSPACTPPTWLSAYSRSSFRLVALSRLQRVQSRQIAVDATAWFWHMMALAWLILFAVLLFGQ